MILRIANAIARYIGFYDDHEAPSPAPQLTEPVRSEMRPASLRLVSSSNTEATAEANPGHKWRRHPQLRSYTSPLTEDVRNGRHESVRGFYAAHAGALEVATEHFTVAARCPEVDLTAVPGFWNLTRGQMQTAVEAYERAGRYRDAAALDAHIQTIFRPSLVGTELAPVVLRKRSELAVN